MALSFSRPKVDDKEIVKKAKAQVKRTAVKAGSSLAAQVQSMVSMAEAKLAHHKDEYIVIRDVDELIAYMEKSSVSGVCAIDTETTGLNPMKVDLVGLCLYAPQQQAAYVPIGHKSYVTGLKTSNQLSTEDIKPILENFAGRWVMHNAKYDIRVLRHTVGVDLDCYWDTMLAAYCIDEIESHRLKDLHLKYCDSTDTESLTFDKLFGGVSFDIVPIKVAYLYAAGDAIKTFELYEYQKALLEKPEMQGPFNVFKNIEMPVLKVCADMEDRGVCLDIDRAKKLQEKYHNIKSERQERANKALEKYSAEIENYRLMNPTNKLGDPINISSPTQLAILFYDILKLESPNKRAPRGTGEDILKHFSQGQHKELCEAILGIREVDKLISTYIDKMPEIVHTDGRIHCNYNQYGAKTGRFSSSDPNMQNIPSHNKEIRTMFKAQDGFIMVGADYSQQEPMVTSYLSQDKKMMQSFIDGRDIYSTIASLAFHKTYEECLEFNTDGTTNAAGKERRSQAKSIVLGILYGRQIPSIAEQLNVTNQEAQGIYDAVLRAFPQLADFINESQTMAKEKGYVTTAWGRRRHLPDMSLEKYEFETAGDNPIGFDPLAFNSDVVTTVPASIKREFTKKLDAAYGWEKKNRVMQQARQQGIKIKDNTGFISQAQRQCVNARVQGSAADMIKLAMVKINNDEEMKQLDAHLIIQVHDEVIVECPEENREAVAERLSYLMRTAPADLIDLPLNCDCDFMKNWYLKEKD